MLNIRKMSMAVIVIVEDGQSLAKSYKIVLEKSQRHNVIYAENGAAALELAKNINPDLIVLDLAMPDMKGSDFLKQYKLKQDHPNVKVVVISNVDGQKDIDLAMSLGATKFFIKAWVVPRSLVEMVDHVLKSKRSKTKV